MGSFAFTCSVSSLPIEAGDKVRVMLITESLFDSRGNYGSDFWTPRTYPLCATYNDYGSVEDVEDGPAKDVWLEGFMLDLAEKGWGDNSCHDVPVLKDMSFDDLLTALSEKRVTVRSAPKHNGFGAAFKELLADAKSSKALKKLLDDAPPKKSNNRQDIDDYFDSIVGAPSLRKIMKIITDNNLPMHGNSEGFMVDEEFPGSVRIRWSGYGTDTQKPKLESIQKLLQNDFAVMLTVGSGHYASEIELLVRPKIGTKTPQGHYLTVNRRDHGKKDVLRVEVVMIREDVWQALLKIGETSESEYYGEKLDYYKLVRNAWESQTDSMGRDHHGATTDLDADGEERKLIFNPGNHRLAEVGLGSHWNLMKAKGLTETQLNSFLRTVAELCIVEDVLNVTRYWWRPSYSLGPQFGNFQMHEKVLTAFAKCANDIATAQERAQIEDQLETDKFWQENGYRIYTEQAEIYAEALEKLKTEIYNSQEVWLHDYGIADKRHTRNGLHWGYPDAITISVTKKDPTGGGGDATYATFVTPKNAESSKFTTNSRYKRVKYSEVRAIIELGISQKLEESLASAAKYPKDS